MISAGLTCFFSNLNVADVVILVSVVILVAFFSMQRYGTDKVGWLFAPIVLVWFLFIGSIGALNIWKYDRSVLKAFNPIYIYRYFKRGKSNWTSLGGIMLSITGLFFLDPPTFLCARKNLFIRLFKRIVVCRNGSVVCWFVSFSCPRYSGLSFSQPIAIKCIQFPIPFLMYLGFLLHVDCVYFRCVSLPSFGVHGASSVHYEESRACSRCFLSIHSRYL